jgi:hypothetical protein
MLRDSFKEADDNLVSAQADLAAARKAARGCQ